VIATLGVAVALFTGLGSARSRAWRGDVLMVAAALNCAGWDRQSKEGAAGKSLIFHGALYFIPMMIFYGGGRREEYCGLMTDDVIEDNNGAHPYLHIAKNKFRRIKNGQSKRNIVIHPELIRLGFLRYVALIRSLGYELVFLTCCHPQPNRRWATAITNYSNRF
jgi:integrase